MTTTTIRPPTHPDQHDHDRGLQAALAAVAEQFGPTVVASPNGTASTPPAVITSGSLALDHALGVGGVPRGRVTEVYGPEGVGKTTLALAVLAQAQRAGGTAVFIDAEHALDLAWTATVGVDTHKLLLCRPDSGEQALQVASVLIGSGSIDALVVDSVAALVPQAELDAAIGEHFAGVQANLLSQAPRWASSPASRPRSSRPASALRPWSACSSSSVVCQAGASLFLTTCARTRVPSTRSCSVRLLGWCRCRRTEA